MSIRIATSLAVALCAVPLLAHAQGGEGSDSLAYKANEQAARPLAPRGPTTVEEMEAFVDARIEEVVTAARDTGAGSGVDRIAHRVHARVLYGRVIDDGHCGNSQVERCADPTSIGTSAVAQDGEDGVDAPVNVADART